ncbi:MAG TPA: AraC family transcriptional regulator [Ruminococcaceae bacterium]|mgnify:FL=1|jgi:AraC-like DNA-binding protein|nr:AraC family transcriptional regulator [Oscillospiraceae bacterium]
MEYISAREAGDKWSITNRMVNYHCVAGRIKGAVKKGNLWLIPQSAEKPADGRRKKGVIQKEQETTVSQDLYDLYVQRRCNGEWPFESLYENEQLFIEIFRHFPYPMHICAPDGTMLLANEAYLEFAKISNPEKLYKKHNIILNPNLERWGIKDFVSRSYQGEVVNAYDVKVPHQEIVERLGDDHELIFGSLYQDMTAFPILDDNHQLEFVITVFITSRYYHDKEEIMKGKEYIDNHCKEEFDIDKLADIVHMSRYHYTRLFKQHTGITPYNYYQDVKLGKLKEKLCDTNLTIAQAFAECGVDYNGNFAKIFRQKTGMNPSRYRKMMIEK